nr:aldehyde dehydrogenase family protein [Rhizobium sp. Root482]
MLKPPFVVGLEEHGPSGKGANAGTALVKHPDVDLVTFTGSVATGTRIMQMAAENLTRVNRELGGNAPAIVLADADLDLAAKAIHASRVINTGQVCNCAERLYVDESVHDAFVAKLKVLFKQTRWGDPSETDDLDMGPLINRAASTRSRQPCARQPKRAPAS